MADDHLFEYEAFQDNETIGGYLSALVEGFEKGRISLRSLDEEIVLSPNNLLQVSIKARKKGSKNKLSIKVTWKDARTPHPNEPTIQIGP